MTKVELSYQRLLAILQPLAEDDARYVLCFLFTRDHDLMARIRNLKRLKAELLHKVEKANNLLDRLKEMYVALQEARSKRSVKVYKELIPLLEKVEQSPELAQDNAPSWRRLVELVEKLHRWLDAEAEVKELVASEEAKTVA